MKQIDLKESKGFNAEVVAYRNEDGVDVVFNIRPSGTGYGTNMSSNDIDLVQSDDGSIVKLIRKIMSVSEGELCHISLEPLSRQEINIGLGFTGADDECMELDVVFNVYGNNVVEVMSSDTSIEDDKIIEFLKELDLDAILKTLRSAKAGTTKALLAIK